MIPRYVLRESIQNEGELSRKDDLLPETNMKIRIPTPPTVSSVYTSTIL